MFQVVESIHGEDSSRTSAQTLCARSGDNAVKAAGQ